MYILPCLLPSLILQQSFEHTAGQWTVNRYFRKDLFSTVKPSPTFIYFLSATLKYPFIFTAVYLAYKRSIFESSFAMIWIENFFSISNIILVFQRLLFPVFLRFRICTMKTEPHYWLINLHCPFVWLHGLKWNGIGTYWFRFSI